MKCAVSVDAPCYSSTCFPAWISSASLQVCRWCIKLLKVDCIWFKSLDCRGTLALLNTHTALLAATLLTARHTAKQTRSHGYQVSTPTAFMTHIAPAIRLVLISIIIREGNNSATKSAIQMKLKQKVRWHTVVFVLCPFCAQIYKICYD